MSFVCKIFLDLLIFSSLLLISINDIRFLTVSNKILFFMLILVLVKYVILGIDFYSFFRSFFVSILFSFVFLLIRKITNNGLGFGDIKLIFVTSFCFGFVKSYIALILACLFGIVFIALKNKKGQEKNKKIPFAPFICSGYFFVQLFCGLVK